MRGGAVWSARRAHNPKVGGSNPPPATKELEVGSVKLPTFFVLLGQIERKPRIAPDLFAGATQNMIMPIYKILRLAKKSYV